jgi:hypothetical protein
MPNAKRNPKPVDITKRAAFQYNRRTLHVFGKRSDDWLTTSLGVEVEKAVSMYKTRATRVAFSSRAGDPAHLSLVAAFEAASNCKSKVKILPVSSLSLVTLDEIGKRGVSLMGTNPDGSQTWLMRKASPKFIQNQKVFKETPGLFEECVTALGTWAAEDLVKTHIPTTRLLTGDMRNAGSRLNAWQGRGPGNFSEMLLVATCGCPTIGPN